MKKSELQGRRFERLIALYDAARTIKKRQVLWLCQCDCGNLSLVRSEDLTSKNTKSCGCLPIENGGKSSITHGGTQKHSKYRLLYKLFHSLHTRCYNSKEKTYKYYGGRGIKVCERWYRNFENFKQDMFDQWKLGLQIDRKDNNGDYSPENCHFTTQKEQSRNRRSNVIFELNGEKKCLKDWADTYQICYKSLHKLIKYKNLPLQNAIEKLRGNSKGNFRSCRNGVAKEHGVIT